MQFTLTLVQTTYSGLAHIVTASYDARSDLGLPQYCYRYIALIPCSCRQDTLIRLRVGR
jgi:hypothetical protein